MSKAKQNPTTEELRERVKQVQLQLAQANRQTQAIAMKQEAAGLNRFGAMLEKRVPARTQTAFLAMYQSLQKGDATPQQLQRLVDSMPVCAIFSPIHADVTGAPMSISPDPYAKEVEQTKKFVARSNKVNK